MDRRGAGEGNGLIEPVARQVLFIARVAGFVNDAKQRAEQVVFVVARGDTDVLGHAATERVGADIQTSAVKIKSQHAHRLQPQFALVGNRKRPLRFDERRLRLLLNHLLQQRRKPGFQIREQYVKTGAGHIGFKNIQQRVVAGTAFCRSPNLCLFATQFDDVTQVLGKTLPVVRRTLAAPGVLAAATRQRFRFHQAFRQQRRLFVLTGHFAQVGLFHII